MKPVNPKKYNKVCNSKELLHKYAREIEYTGLLKLYKVKVIVIYFYIRGIPMLHEVQKNSKRDNSIWQSGRTQESYDNKLTTGYHVDFLLAENLIDRRQHDFQKKNIEIIKRMKTLKYKFLKRKIGEFQQSYICNGELFKRKSILEECI